MASFVWRHVFRLRSGFQQVHVRRVVRYAATPLALTIGSVFYTTTFSSTKPSQPEKNELDLRVLFDPVAKVDFTGKQSVILGWSRKDPQCYLEERELDGRTQLLRVNAKTGEFSVVIDALPAFTQLEGEDMAHKIVGKMVSKSLNRHEDQALYEVDGALFYYNAAINVAMRVTEPDSHASCPKMSPDGTKVSFVVKNDLYVFDFLTLATTRLTHTGSDTKFNGKLDWVYQEEVFGRGKFASHWWSPDSSHLAFLEIDDEQVPECHGVVDNSKVHAMCEITRYPQAGDPNPQVRLGVCGVKGDSDPVFLHTGAPDTLLCRVRWTPDGKGVLFQTQNRQQTWLDLNCSYLSGETSRLFRETSSTWVDVNGNPKFLDDGSFLWVSQRSGHPGVYRYTLDGKCQGTVLEGFGLSKLHGVKKTGVFFTGCADLRQLEQHVYRLDLTNGEVVPLTTSHGTHNVSFNKDFTLFSDSFSDVLNPPRTSIYNEFGSLVRKVDPGTYQAQHKRFLSDVQAPKFLQVKTRDGTDLEAMMILPKVLEEGKKYPVICYQYSGPATPLVKNRWGGPNYLWHQMMANKGYIIWVCDVRTASGKPDTTSLVYRKFGESEMRDIEDEVSFLSSLPFVDKDRLGIWGWSFGGYIAALALTHPAKLFKCGISGAPVTDWQLYDSIYTERYMDTPLNNKQGYSDSSVVRQAKNLQGKLLLIHGTMDDNVHIQNSVQLIHELQKNNIPFEYMCYPNSRHGVDSPLVPHYRQLITDFFVRSL